MSNTLGTIKKKNFWFYLRFWKDFDSFYLLLKLKKKKEKKKVYPNVFQ